MTGPTITPVLGTTSWCPGLRWTLTATSSVSTGGQKGRKASLRHRRHQPCPRRPDGGSWANQRPQKMVGQPRVTW